MHGAVLLTPASPADYAGLADVMFDAVRNGPSPYSDAQRAQWVPERRSGPAWSRRLDRQQIVLARQDDVILGFMSLDAGGYVDFAYIRPVARGGGLFRRLFARVEAYSLDRGDDRLWVHASRMAEPAFRAVGFALIERQVVAIGDERLDRAEMEKRHQPA